MRRFLLLLFLLTFPALAQTPTNMSGLEISNKTSPNKSVFAPVRAQSCSALTNQLVGAQCYQLSNATLYRCDSLSANTACATWTAVSTPVIYASLVSTGGTGTAADPWTGWTTAVTGGNKSVYFTNGYYGVAANTQITLSSDTDLDGDGSAHIVPLADDSGNYAIFKIDATAATKSNIRIRNVVIDANGKNRVYGIFAASASTYQTQDLTIQNCQFLNWTRTAINIQDYSRVRIVGNYFLNPGSATVSGNSGNAIQAGSSNTTSTDLNITDNTIIGFGSHSNTGSGTHAAISVLFRVDGVKISRNTLDGGYKGSVAIIGINLTESTAYGYMKNIEIVDNVIKNWEGTAINLTKGNGHESTTGYVISHNIVDAFSTQSGADTPAIFTANVDDGSVIGNIVTNGGASGNCGIEVNTSSHVTVSGNTVANGRDNADPAKKYAGIWATGTNITMSNNVVNNTTRACYQSANGDTIHIVGNTGKDCGLYGIEINPTVSGTNYLVSNNLIADDSGDGTLQTYGIDIGPNVVNMIIKDNTILGYASAAFYNSGLATVNYYQNITSATLTPPTQSVAYPTSGSGTMVLDTTATSSTTPITITNGIGSRGLTADANADGTADTKLWPTFQTSNGPPISVTRSGFGTVRTLPDRGPQPVVVLAFDEHSWDTNMAYFQTVCAQYNLPCTIHTMLKAGAAYPTSAQVQAWTANGFEVGNHGAYHGAVGFDSINGNRYWVTANGLRANGTGVTCTNGSTAVTGTLTTFNETYPAGSASTVGACLVCDWNNNNAIADDDRQHCIPIASVQSNTALTLAYAYGGTTTTTHPYEIRAGYERGRTEFGLFDAAAQSLLGTDFISGSACAPGSAQPWDDMAVLAAAARGIPDVFTLNYTSAFADNETNYWGQAMGGHFNPSRMEMTTVNCQETGADLSAMIDNVVKERRFLQFNFEEVIPDASCTTGQQGIGQSAWATMAAHISDLRDKGFLRVMTAEEGAMYLRSIPQPQYGMNALRNYNFTEIASFNGTVAAPLAGIPGWYAADTDAGTAHIQHSTKHTAWSGDGAGQLTATNAGAAESDFIRQYVQLAPNQTYIFGVTVDCSGVTAGNVSVSLYDQGTTDSTDIVRALDPVWYESNGISNGGYTKGFKYRANSQLYDVCGSQNGTHGVYASFHTPELFNEGLIFQFDLSAAFTGTVKFRDVALTAISDHHRRNPWGTGNGIKWSEISRAIPYTTLTAQNNEAFSFSWLPPEGSYDSDTNGSLDATIRQDVPTPNLYAWRYIAADDSNQRVAYGTIAAKGILNTWVTGYAYSGFCADTASATTITADNCSMVTITGSTAITTLNTCDATNKGRELTILCGSATAVVTDGNNLKLAGNFTCTADDALTLICDGTNWIERSRSAN